MFMPFQIVGLWLRALLAPAVLIAGCFLLYRAFDRVEQATLPQVLATAERNGNPQPHAGVETMEIKVRAPWGPNRETAYFIAGLLLLGFSLGGGLLLSPRTWRAAGSSEPKPSHAESSQLVMPSDGTTLHVVTSGPATAPAVVFVHGWGLNHNAWSYSDGELGDAFRRITWDLPGLGASTQPRDRNFSLERMAEQLHAVLTQAGPNPVTLVGHSIGTMIILTYCKLHPEALGKRVGRLVLAHGTYTNPVRTTKRAWLYQALQKPLLEPLCYLMIWLSPLVGC